MKIITDEISVDELRRRRQDECFTIVNRGKLWYNTLSIKQLSELTVWYNKWLDVTKTRVIPVAPNWLNDKVKKEEILL